MKLYRNDCTDPSFNLAIEQYLLDRGEEEPVFMLWRNAPSVILGRNQNAYAEVDTEFVRTHHIDVIRRLTGGGAVFHDLGNVNFSFITPSDGSGIDFPRFCRPVIEALATLGVAAELSGRNDILVDGHKVSGNAQCVRNGHVLHHGTLLFSSDMSELAGSLRVDPDKIRSKGVSSVRSRVANIRDYLAPAFAGMDAVGFKNYLETYFSATCTAADFTEADVAAIEALRDSRYGTWEWNFGRSGDYGTRHKRYFPFGLLDADVSTDAGRITAIRLQGDYFGVRDIAELEASLVGVRFERDAVAEKLASLGEYIQGATPSDLLDLLFLQK